MKLRRSVLAVKPRSRHQVGALAATTLMVLFVSCSYATLPPRVVEGKEFAIENASQLQDGMAAKEAEDLLGAPLEIEETSDGESWRYYARIRKDGVTYFLGFIGKKSPHFIWDYELTFMVRDNQVHQVCYKETKVR